MRNPLEVTCYNEIGLPCGDSAKRLQWSPITPPIIHTLLDQHGRHLSVNHRVDEVISNICSEHDASWRSYNFWSDVPQRATYVVSAIISLLVKYKNSGGYSFCCHFTSWDNLSLEQWHRVVDLNVMTAIAGMVKNPAIPTDILRRLQQITPVWNEEEGAGKRDDAWIEKNYSQYRRAATTALSRRDMTVSPPEINISCWEDALTIATDDESHPLYLEKVLEYVFSKNKPVAKYKNDERLIGDVLKNPNTSPEVRRKTCDWIKSSFDRYAENGGGIKEIEGLYRHFIFYPPIMDYIGCALLYRLLQLDLPYANSEILELMSWGWFGTAEEVEACWATPPKPLFTGAPYDYQEKGMPLSPERDDKYGRVGDARLTALRPHSVIKHLLALHPKAPKHIVVAAEESAPDDIKKLVAQYRNDDRARRARGEIGKDGAPIIAADDADDVKKAFETYVKEYRQGRIPLKDLDIDIFRRFVAAGCNVTDLTRLIIEKLKSWEPRVDGYSYCSPFFFFTVAELLELHPMPSEVYESALEFSLGSIRVRRTSPFMVESIS